MGYGRSVLLSENNSGSNSPKSDICVAWIEYGISAVFFKKFMDDDTKLFKYTTKTVPLFLGSYESSNMVLSLFLRLVSGSW